MIRRVLWCVALACSIPFFAGGCESDEEKCEKRCEAADACDDVIPDTRTCKERCADQKVLLEESNCGETQSKFDACRDALEDICTAAGDCGTEARDILDCIGDYCDANAGAPSCPGGS